MAGLFGDLFDFNHDGKLDSFEKAAEFATFAPIMNEAEDEEEMKSELEAAGLDAMELDFMDAVERRDVLEVAGLDPDEFDF